MKSFRFWADIVSQYQFEEDWLIISTFCLQNGNVSQFFWKTFTVFNKSTGTISQLLKTQKVSLQPVMGNLRISFDELQNFGHSRTFRNFKHSGISVIIKIREFYTTWANVCVKLATKLCNKQMVHKNVQFANYGPEFRYPYSRILSFKNIWTLYGKFVNIVKRIWNIRHKIIFRELLILGCQKTVLFWFTGKTMVGLQRCPRTTRNPLMKLKAPTTSITGTFAHPRIPPTTFEAVIFAMRKT